MTMADHECKYEDRLIGLCEAVARVEAKLDAVDKRINGSIDDIENHIGHGTKWRVAILSLAVTLLLVIGSGLFTYGQLCEKVNRIDKIQHSIIVSGEKV